VGRLKKILGLLLAVVFALGASAACAENYQTGTNALTPASTPDVLGRDSSRVFDFSALMTQSEITQLTDAIVLLRGQYGMDIVIVTSGEPEPGKSQEFADGFYDENGFGAGIDSSGILFLIDMNNREFCISTSGLMIRYVTDARLDALLDGAMPYLSEGRYAEGAFAALAQLAVYLEDGIPAGQYNEDETGDVDPYATPTPL
jgi:uncharacterized protein